MNDLTKLANSLRQIDNVEQLIRDIVNKAVWALNEPIPVPKSTPFTFNVVAVDSVGIEYRVTDNNHRVSSFDIKAIDGLCIKLNVLCEFLSSVIDGSVVAGKVYKVNDFVNGDEKSGLPMQEIVFANRDGSINWNNLLGTLREGLAGVNARIQINNVIASSGEKINLEEEKAKLGAIERFSEALKSHINLSDMAIGDYSVLPDPKLSRHLDNAIGAVSAMLGVSSEQRDRRR